MTTAKLLRAGVAQAQRCARSDGAISGIMRNSDIQEAYAENDITINGTRVGAGRCANIASTCLSVVEIEDTEGGTCGQWCCAELQFVSDGEFAVHCLDLCDTDLPDDIEERAAVVDLDGAMACAHAAAVAAVAVLVALAFL